MGISINIALQMARCTHLLDGKTNGIMLGRQKMHFRESWKRRFIRGLSFMDIEW